MNNIITLHIRQTADLLTATRVSQDGWAKVLERTVTDLHDLAAALQSGKIVAHVPAHLTGIALAAAKAHGISEAAVQSTCKSIRQALEDCYVVITGETRE